MKRHDAVVAGADGDALGIENLGYVVGVNFFAVNPDCECNQPSSIFCGFWSLNLKV